MQKKICAKKLVKINPHYHWQKCMLVIIVSGNIRFICQVFPSHPLMVPSLSIVIYRQTSYSLAANVNGNCYKVLCIVKIVTFPGY